MRLLNRRFTWPKTAVAVVALGLLTAGVALAGRDGRGRGNNDQLGTVYVTSQGLYYDTFVPVDALPHEGPFQDLQNGVTEFGPGDQGYVGGRWRVLDDNGDTLAYLLCPLLGPGRTSR
jgi:hypothetical protein